MNNNMYLYFDSNGYLKEFITCPARAGSENVNSIYFYVEPALESDRNKVDGNGDAYYALPNNLDHGVLTFKLHDVLNGVTDENGVVLNSLAFTSANFRIEDIQPFNKKRDLLFFKWVQKYQFVKVNLTADILLNPGNVECTIGCYNSSNIKVYNLDLFSFYVADSAVQSANYVTTSQYHMLLALMQSGLSSAVSRYDIDALDTLADIYDLIGTQISVLNIDDKEYLVEMSNSGSIVLYDLYNREWYVYEGSDETAIDDITRYLYRYHIATKEDLEAFGNLFIYKGTASVAQINALTNISNGWAYNLTDSGTLTLGNLSVETGDNIAFDGTIWTKLSSETVLGQYYTKQEGQVFEQDVNEQIDAIENQVQQVASGSPKGVYSTLAALQAAYPTGTTGIYVVSEDGHWYYWNGSAWTDGGAYLSSQDELDTYVVNKDILFNGYNETITSAPYVMKYIFIPKGAYITLTNLTDDDVHSGFFTIRYTDNTTYASGAIRKNISFSLYASKDINLIYLNINAASGTFRLQIEPIITTEENKIKKLENNFIPDNLFDKTAVSAGWIATNTGVIYESSDISTSDYIPIKSQTTYSFKMNLVGHYGETAAKRIPMYDENKTFIGYIEGTLNEGILTFTTPITYYQGSVLTGNFRYCRFSSANNDLNNVMFVEGNSYPNEYIGYEETLLASNIGLNQKQKNEVTELAETISPLYGKKIAYNGDSICESRLNESSNAYNGGAYAKLIADVTGCTYENRAQSGGILASDTPDHNPPAKKICLDVSNMAADADLICFEGGINDYWRGVPLGTFSESDYSGTLDTTTLLGALESILRQATTRWVGKPICFIIVHKITTTVYSQNSAGYTFKQAHEQMKSLCKKYAIPVFDAFEDSGLNGYNSIQNTNFLTANSSGTPDGCHPNKAGYENYYVPQLIKLFESLIKRNS